MLGDRDVRRIIEKAIDKIYDESKQNVDKDNPERIHAFEVSHCTRLSYYDRKDPLPDDNAETISILMKNSIRRLFNNIHGEYKVNNLTLEVTADMIINDEFVVRFEIVPSLPEIPHPQDLLYVNACLFSFNKNDGILIYISGEGKDVEFSITKNNRMFEEIIRRARILSTLLKENKVPIIEPCDLCLRCKYYERCYSRERKTPSSSLENLLSLGLGKKKSN
jgi:CRISPR-associated exonuclease Cas4